MKEQDLKVMAEKMTKFTALKQRRSELKEALLAMRQKNGNLDDPFTGNTRESRQIESMTICFTRTLGGEPPTSVELRNLKIEAHEIGNAIESLICRQIEVIQEAMDEL